MFGKKKGPSRPTGPFAHAEGCKIVVAEPDFQPEWQEIETGHWRRICQCYPEDLYEPPTDDRVRRDPLDPATYRHGPACEFQDVTDPKLLRAVLKVADGAGGDYWWGQCSGCDCGWQVAYFEAESVG